MLFKVQTKSASSSQYNGSFCVRRAVFNPPFPNIINLGDDVPDVEIIPAKPFVSQMIVSPVPMSSDSSFSGGKATLAKRKLYDTIEANRDVNACPRLKAVKIERD